MRIINRDINSALTIDIYYDNGTSVSVVCKNGDNIYISYIDNNGMVKIDTGKVIDIQIFNELYRSAIISIGTSNKIIQVPANNITTISIIE